MYFVTSDIHSYFTIFKKELDKQGFDINNPEHKLIICGDLFDRGVEPKELIDFLLSIPEDRLILIKGNHEDLLFQLLKQLKNKEKISYYHLSNGTLNTISYLTDNNSYDLELGLFNYQEDIECRLKDAFKLLKRAVNYCEIGDYIFVHGWIPLRSYGYHYKYDKNWRKASNERWKLSRWFNGIDMVEKFSELNKTIVCGHWHCSYGWHKKYPDKYGAMDNFEIFKDKGIIALDACTVYSGKCNILKLDI